jgi:hypothetical protein
MNFEQNCLIAGRKMKTQYGELNELRFFAVVLQAKLPVYTPGEIAREKQCG